MPNTIVIPEGAPPPVGPFAPARIASGSKVLTISGQIADGPDGGVVGGDGAEEQARQCLRNIDALLRSAGATRDDVVKVGIFRTDIADRAAVARARVEYFGDHKPASTLFEVPRLVAPELKVEIEATAIF
jgi:2-iminobutanoate/2-iminopropanoate deaminase